MKKSIKILALILTLALVCGVFVIGAFAAEGEAEAPKYYAGSGYSYGERETVKGETVMFYINYDHRAAENFGSAKDLANEGSHYTLKSNDGKSAALVYGQRQGVAAIRKSQYENNLYLEYVQDPASVYAANKGPYQQVALFGMPSFDDVKSGAADAYKATSYKYYVLDFDMAQAGDIGGNFSLMLMGRTYYKQADGTYKVGFTQGATDANKVADLNAVSGKDSSLNISSNAGQGNKVYFNCNAGWSTKTDVSTDGSWNHYTWVIEIDTFDDGENAGYLKLNAYLFINGKLEIIQENLIRTYNTTAKEYFVNNDPTNVFYNEVRLMFGNNANGSTTCYDNFAVRTFDKNYDGNFASVLATGRGADISAWDANVYSQDYMPFAALKATITPAAGDAKYFDRVADAFAAAVTGDKITLAADATGTMVVNAAGITVDKAGFNCDLVAAEGLQIKEKDGVFVSEAVSAFFNVTVEACWCGEHWDETEVKISEGSNIYDAIAAKVGTCAYTEEGTLYSLIGWEDADGVYEIDENTVVTEDMLDQYAYFWAIYDETAPLAAIYNANGDVSYEYNNVIAAIKGLTNGQSIKLFVDVNLLDDSDVATKGLTVSANATIDLNGYKITRVDTRGTKFSQPMFKATNTLTFTSSVEGGAVYGASVKGAGTAYGDMILGPGANGSTFRLNGADENGNTTLKMYGPTLFQGYGNWSHIYINGGEYYRTCQDNYAFIDCRGTGNMEFKNALFYNNGISTSSRIIRMNTAGGVNAVGGVADVTVNVDNCVFLNGNFTDFTFTGLKVNITNSVFEGGICATIEGTSAGSDVSGWTIGAGNFFGPNAGINPDIKYAKDVMTVEGVYTKSYTLLKNNFVAGYKAEGTAVTDESYALTESTHTVNCNRATIVKADPVDVKFYNGDKLIGTAVGYPGLPATAPKINVNSFVDAVYTADAWTDGAIVPAGVTEASFNLVDATKVTYVAADTAAVEVLFNFDMINHYQYNFYVKKDLAEGITVDSMSFTGAVSYANVAPAQTKNNNAGEEYLVWNRWPGVPNTAGDVNIAVNLTYTDANGVTANFAVAVKGAVNLAKYVNYILDNQAAYSAEFVTTMADMMRFIDTHYTLNGKETTAEFKAVYAKAEDLMSDIAEIKAEEYDISAIAEYVEIYFEYNKGSGAMTLTASLKNATSGYGVAITLKNPVAHNMNLVGETRSLDNAKTTFSAHNIRTYGMAQVFVVTVYEKAVYKVSNAQVLDVENCGAVVASAEYSMAAYITAMGDELPVATLNVVKATYAYAASADAYMAKRFG